MLTTLIELSLVLMYLSVLLIKTCDASSLGKVRLHGTSRNATNVDVAVPVSAITATMKAACSGFGFGDSASGEPLEHTRS